MSSLVIGLRSFIWDVDDDDSFLEVDEVDVVLCIGLVVEAWYLVLGWPALTRRSTRVITGLSKFNPVSIIYTRFHGLVRFDVGALHVVPLCWFDKPSPIV